MKLPDPLGELFFIKLAMDAVFLYIISAALIFRQFENTHSFPFS